MKKFFVLLCSVFWFSCAQQKVALEERRLIPFEAFSETTYLPFATLPVKLEAVLDNRETGRAVGEARTGAQFKKTPVYFEGDFLEVFRGYFLNSLKKRNVLMVQEDHEVVLTVMVQAFWVEEVLEKYQPEKAKCEIALEIAAAKGSDQYAGKFWSKIVSPGDLGDATEKLAPTAASCMNAALEKLVNDKKFIEFIKSPPLLE